MHPARAQARRVQPDRGAGSKQHGAAHGLAGRVLFDGRVRPAAAFAAARRQVLPEALKIASLIAAMPPLAVMQIKEVVLAGVDASLETAQMLERKANQLLFCHARPEGRHAGLHRKAQAEVRGALGGLICY